MDKETKTSAYHNAVKKYGSKVKQISLKLRRDVEEDMYLLDWLESEKVRLGMRSLAETLKEVIRRNANI